jgi:hypothetical protein
MDNPFTEQEMIFLRALGEEQFDPPMPATTAAMAVGIVYADWPKMGYPWQEVGGWHVALPSTTPPCPWRSRREYLARAREIRELLGLPQFAQL